MFHLVHSFLLIFIFFSSSLAAVRDGHIRAVPAPSNQVFRGSNSVVFTNNSDEKITVSYCISRLEIVKICIDPGRSSRLDNVNSKLMVARYNNSELDRSCCSMIMRAFDCDKTFVMIDKAIDISFKGF